MKTATWILGALLAFAAVAFAALPNDRVLAEKKVEECSCQIVWRYSPFSLTREAGELVFSSTAQGRTKEVRSGFVGDWSGNTAIEWKQLSGGVIEASDRFSGRTAVFRSDGSITQTR